MLAKLIALVAPLGLDTFAVAAAIGMTGVTAAGRRRMSLLFTAFEAGMPLIGLALGGLAGRAVGSAAAYIAIAILLAFGLHTLFAGDDDDEQIRQLPDVTGVRMLALGMSISLDELAIGFTIGLLHLPVVPVIAVIAVQTLVVTQAGLRLGGRLGSRVPERAGKLGGAALATLGLVLLLERLLS